MQYDTVILAISICPLAFLFFCLNVAVVFYKFYAYIHRFGNRLFVKRLVPI